jgi:hypothetical protein
MKGILISIDIKIAREKSKRLEKDGKFFFHSYINFMIFIKCTLALNA